MKILLVEDQAFILMDIELQLQQDSHLVVSASNADNAIVVLRNQAVDVVLTDIDMPGSMDGIGLAAAVRDRWPSVRIVGHLYGSLSCQESNVRPQTNYRRRPGLCRSHLTNRSSCTQLVRGKLGILKYPSAEDAGMVYVASVVGRRWKGGLWA